MEKVGIIAPKKMKSKAKKKNIVGLITVEKFDLANPLRNCSTFVTSLLAAPWSLTLAGLKLASTNSKPNHYKQKAQKLADLPKTWVLTRKQFEDFRRKKIHF